MEKNYFDFFTSAGNILKSSGSCLKKINMILIMMIEYFSFRNPILIIHDTITNKENIELAPELTGTELNDAKYRLNEYISSLPHTFCHKLILSPKEAEKMPLVLPENLMNNYEIFVSYPITGREKSVQLGVFAAFIQKEEFIKERIDILNIITDMIGFYLDNTPCCHVQDSGEFAPDQAPMVLEGVVGKSQAMKNIGEITKKISVSRASVFIHGESGTGKELIARAVHRYSLRSHSPFMAVNCAALNDELLASELFGHVKGAFTGAARSKKGRFEEADGGTLFLDEIGDTTLNFQKKLLRVLQEGEFEPIGSNKTVKVDVRIVCSTNSDIENAIREGTFREDLYYRLNVIFLEIPPLSERREDIPLLVDFFLESLNLEYGKSVKIAKKTVRLLQEMDWPGNVRQLENFVHRAFVMEQDGFIRLENTFAHSAEPLSRPVAAKNEKREPAKQPEARTGLALKEIRAIETALAASKGVQVKAARLLGISLRQLRYRIGKYDIEVKKIRI